MLTLEMVEWFISHAKPDAQIVLLDSGNPHSIAQQDAGFACIFQTLLKAQDGRQVWLEQDHQNRTVCTKLG